MPHARLTALWQKLTFHAQRPLTILRQDYAPIRGSLTTE